MRTKFTLGVMKEPSGTFPSDAALCQWLRSFGWEPKDAANKGTDDEKRVVYSELAGSMFDEMPEVAQDEKEDLIFASRFPSEQTRFLVTRSSEGKLTFRFLHEDLPNLFAGTDRLIRAIHDQVYRKPPITLGDGWWIFRKHSTRQDLHTAVTFISTNTVLLYERASDRVIMRGRIIRNFFKEACWVNFKDALVSARGGG